MKRVLVLSLTLFFLLSSLTSVLAAEDWWFENRRSSSEESRETEAAEPDKEPDKRDGTSDRISAVDWWLANRRGQTQQDDPQDESRDSVDEDEDGNEDEGKEEKEEKEETRERVDGQQWINWWYELIRDGDRYEDSGQDPDDHQSITPGDDEIEENDREDVDSPSIDNDAEQYLFNAINEEREERGIEPLEYSSKVSEVARKKAQDMVENDYFAHESPTYGSAGDMLRDAGISFGVSKENLARAGSASSAHSLLMSSSGHRSGILGERYTHVGIGVAETPGGGIKATQIFIER